MNAPCPVDALQEGGQKMKLEYQGPESGFNRSAAHTSRLWGSGLTERPDWHADAACGRNGILGDDPKARVRIMFPKRGESLEAAKGACDVCPVLEQCRNSLETTAIFHARRFGVWGRTSPEVRRGRKVS